MSEKKMRPCLKCGSPFLTTPEWRICRKCHEVVENANRGAYHIPVTDWVSNGKHEVKDD